MVYVYKLGLKYLNKSKEDKNSGKWELEKIKKVAEGYKGRTKILLVVSGLADEYDITFVENVIKKHVFDKVVFVMTDTGSLKYMNLVNKCDLLLHQAWLPVDGVTIEQQYGYMPELFYEEKAGAPNKNNIILFGGNNLNRADELRKLCFNGSRIQDGLCLLLKDYEAGTDYRVDHKAYLKLLAQCSYSLVLSSPWIYEHGWITARMLEAFSVNNVPLVTYGYDKTGWYNHTYTRVNNYFDMQGILNGKHSIEIKEELENNRALARSREYKFAEIIYSL